MKWCVTTLLLIAVAIMASVPAANPAQGLRGQVTLFVCPKCTETGQLSCWGQFLSQAAVLRHMAASKLCFAAKLGFRELQVDIRISDVMAGAGGAAAGPAPDVQHQPEGH